MVSWFDKLTTSGINYPFVLSLSKRVLSIAEGYVQMRK